VLSTFTNTNACLPTVWVAAGDDGLPCEPRALSASRRAQTVVGGRDRGHADKQKGFVVAKKSKNSTVTWTPNPAERDYPAAESFLRLIAAADVIKICTDLLSEAPTVHQHAKDILRAAGLPLLATDDPEVAKDLKEVATGIALSPILLIAGDIGTGRALQIAMGTIGSAPATTSARTPKSRVG
jgi:hypothetical protein